MRFYVKDATEKLLALVTHKLNAELKKGRASKADDILKLSQAAVYIEALVKAGESEDRYAKLADTLQNLPKQQGVSTAEALATLTKLKKPDPGPGNVGKN